MAAKIEYVMIHSFPEYNQQVWKMQYYVGEVMHHGTKFRMGQAMLDGVDVNFKRGRKRKIIKFNGFVTDWLSIKGCKIIGHDTDIFNFVSPPIKKRKKKKEQEFESLQKLLQWQKNKDLEIQLEKEVIG